MERELVKEIFYSPPVIFTERLILRPIALRDASDMYEYSCDPDVTRFLTWEPHVTPHFTKRHIKRIEKAYHEGRFFDWALEVRSSGKMIGTCGFTSFSYTDNSCEIGYVLNPRYHGYSLATEAARTVIDFAFSKLSANSVFARCMSENTASRRVMEKCGMIFEKDIERTVIKQNKYVKVSQYRITLEMYLKGKQGKTF